jgi:hypothetical protein
LALKLFDCERTAITQLNKSLKFTGYVTHLSCIGWVVLFH